MRRRFDRAVLAATLVGTLLIPVMGSIAGPKQQLEQTQDRLEEIRNKIDADKAKASTLKEKVQVLNQSLTDLQVEVAKLDKQAEQIRYRVRNAQARIDATQVEIDAIQEEAVAQASELYKSGAFETIDALMNSESLAELDERIEMLGVAARQNTGALVKYGRLQVKIRGEKLELFKIQDELNSTLEVRRTILAEQTKRKGELEVALIQLRAELGTNKDKERHLENESDRFAQLLLEHQAKASVAALGTSGKGFIWPLNGNVTSYYGPRWGRMHTGIDIDGYSGQPIVATKEGQVVLASYYSGYGNAVIVDHGGGYATLYAHMSEFNTSNGASVKQGDVIGYVGCTGSCTGDHLHFEVRVNGEPVDPMPYLP
jgi:murein DD-endopeptidase MepM/ murein hydrolase activator NlpD